MDRRRPFDRIDLPPPHFHTYLSFGTYCSTMPGISTCCLMSESLPSALDRIAPFTDLIEIMDEGPHFVTDPGLFESYSQMFILHAPFHGINIASVFEPIRRASVLMTSESFQTASDIGAKGVVVHPGYFAWVQEKETADRQFQKSLYELQKAATDNSVTFWFENMGNMNFFNLRTPEDLLLTGKAGLALDIGHAFLNGCLDRFLRMPFRHMHIHDNTGRTDTHSAVGKGAIDFFPVKRALERTGASAVFEMKDIHSVEKSREVFSII